MATVFMSYSHKDEALRDQLEAHLALLRNQGLIETWHDRRILAGEQFDDAIFDKLETADIILLLVSSDFISSDYCYSREMTRAMERHHAREAYVVPVILRPCDWHSAKFGGLMAVPKDGKAITTWADRDEAFTDVAKQIRRHVEALSAKPAAERRVAPEKPRAVDESRPSDPGTFTFQPELVEKMERLVSRARSSNLRLKKEFSDKDKADFLRDTFEFICRFFENSVEAIGERNADVEGQFDRIDKRTMTAVIYRNGKTLAECSIRLDGRMGGDREIAFSHDASVRANSYNEMLSVEAGDYEMHVKPLGMAMMMSGAGASGTLSHEGAAEYLWKIFIRQAQQ